MCDRHTYRQTDRQTDRQTQIKPRTVCGRPAGIEPLPPPPPNHERYENTIREMRELITEFHSNFKQIYTDLKRRHLRELQVLTQLKSDDSINRANQASDLGAMGWV